LAHEERMLVIHRLHEVLRPFVLRRVKSAVLGQLPEKVEKVLRVDLTAWQQVLYEQIRQTGVAKKDSPRNGDVAAPPISRGLNNVLMQLRKVCNHPFLFRSDAWTVDESLIRSSGKFLLLDSMLPKLKAAGHRVLLFSQMTALMDLLEDFFRYRSYEFLRLDGSTAADERERRMARFNDPSSPAFVFLLSTRAGGLGLNLASADTVVIFDSDWNPMMDAQAQDRAHRIGQKNDVRVFRLCSTSPVEERILQRATDKLNMNSLVVEAGQFSRDSKADERRQMVEELLKEYQEPSDESNDEDKKEGIRDDLCEAMASSNDEIQLYRQVDASRQALTPYTQDDVPTWVKQGCDGADAAALERAQAKTQSRSDFGDFSGDPSQRRARSKKRDYAGMSDRSFMKLIQGGASVGYEPVGTDDGAMRIKLKKKRP
jgi:SNF2 family DNA or RNA helicase